MNEAMYYVEMAELGLAKADIMLEAYDAYEELDARSAELRAYVEDGMDAMYEAVAVQQNVEKKKNVLARAYDAVLKLLRTIKDKIFSAISHITGKDDETVQVPAECVDSKIVGKINEIMAKIKSFGETTPGKVVTAIGIAVAALLAAFGLYKGGKKILMRRKDVKKAADTYGQHASVLHGFVEKLKGWHAAAVESRASRKEMRAQNRADARAQRQTLKEQDLLDGGRESTFKRLFQHIKDLSQVFSKIAQKLHGALAKKKGNNPTVEVVAGAE